MTLLKRMSAIFSKPSYSDDEILRAFEPWTLACAVGSENGSLGARMGYQYWLSRSQPNWMPGIRARLHGVRERRVLEALEGFVRANIGRDYRDVLEAESAARGEIAGAILGPGESTTVRLWPSADEAMKP